MFTDRVCPAVQEIDWDNCPTCGGSEQKAMWAVIAVSTALTSMITLYTFWRHTAAYRVPLVQKQILRILLLPLVFAIMSLASFRWFHEYEYLELAQACTTCLGALAQSDEQSVWDAISIAAFMLLMYRLVIFSVTGNPAGDEVQFFNMLHTKVEGEGPSAGVPWPWPISWYFKIWCLTCHFWQKNYRPSEFTVRVTLLSVLQIMVIRPLIDLYSAIGEKSGGLCPQIYSIYFGELWVEVIDFISVSVAIMGLIAFFGLCKAELKDHNALHKFLAIKLIVAVIFYQAILISILKSAGYIQATQYYTADDAAKLWSSVATSVEMCFFAVYMWRAYDWKDYEKPKLPKEQRGHIKQHLDQNDTYISHSRGKALWDCINMSDFFTEMWGCIKFLTHYGQSRHSAEPLRHIKDKLANFFTDVSTRQKKYQDETESRAEKIKNAER